MGKCRTRRRRRRVIFIAVEMHAFSCCHVRTMNSHGGPGDWGCWRPWHRYIHYRLKAVGVTGWLPLPLYVNARAPHRKSPIARACSQCLHPPLMKAVLNRSIYPVVRASPHT
jgi:hypothetical protein